MSEGVHVELQYVMQGGDYARRRLAVVLRVLSRVCETMFSMESHLTASPLRSPPFTLPQRRTTLDSKNGIDFLEQGRLENFTSLFVVFFL